MSSQIIKTSEEKWFVKIANCYKNKLDFTLVDDLGIGIDPSKEYLFQMGIKAKLAKEEWVATGIAMGIGAAGLAMIILAVADPEPTSKLGLMLVSGAVLVLGGGFQAIRTLTKAKPPNVKVGPGGFDISWD